MNTTGTMDRRIRTPPGSHQHHPHFSSATPRVYARPANPISASRTPPQQVGLAPVACGELERTSRNLCQVYSCKASPLLLYGPWVWLCLSTVSTSAQSACH